MEWSIGTEVGVREERKKESLIVLVIYLFSGKVSFNAKVR